MGEAHQYSVRFGRTAGELVYEDREGTLYFFYDVKPSNEPQLGQWTVELGARPLSRSGSDSAPALDWDTVALERTTAYLVSRGYQVELLR